MVEPQPAPVVAPGGKPKNVACPRATTGGWACAPTARGANRDLGPGAGFHDPREFLMTSTDLVLFRGGENEITGQHQADMTAKASRMFGFDLGGLFECMDWAEEEIAAARARFPRAADLLFHSFTLLRPGTNLTRSGTEFVYRSHCRELLDRVARGHDTRTATAAEICCVLGTVSHEAKLNSAAFGLYLRMWITAGFPLLPEFTEASTHHEALEHTTIDDYESFARSKLADPERVLGAITCCGLHHGENVECAYTPPRQLALGA